MKSDVKKSQDMSCKGVDWCAKLFFFFWYRLFMCFQNDLGVIYLYLTTIPGSLFQKKKRNTAPGPRSSVLFLGFFGKSQVISVLPMGFDPRTSPKTPEPSIYIYIHMPQRQPLQMSRHLFEAQSPSRSRHSGNEKTMQGTSMWDKHGNYM